MGIPEDLGPHGLGPDAYGLEIDTDGTMYLILGTGEIYNYDRASNTATLVGATGLQVFGSAFRVPAGPAIGDAFSFCSTYTVPNSTGASGKIEVSGSTVAADNGLTLTAKDLPPSSFGIFLSARFGRIEAPFPSSTSDGLRCSSGSTGLFSAPGQIQQVDSSVQFSLDVDLNNLPSAIGVGSVMAGDSLVFQSWFRDSGPQGNNYSDAVMVIFR